jgi:hypothetical protein
MKVIRASGFGYNNTRWAINFCTPSLYVGAKVAPLRLNDGRAVLGLRDGVEVTMCHEVEAVKAMSQE